MTDIVSKFQLGEQEYIPLVCQVSRTAVDSTYSIKKNSPKHLAHLGPFFLESMQKIVQTKLRTIFRRCATCLHSKFSNIIPFHHNVFLVWSGENVCLSLHLLVRLSKPFHNQMFQRVSICLEIQFNLFGSTVRVDGQIVLFIFISI